MAPAACASVRPSGLGVSSVVHLAAAGVNASGDLAGQLVHAHDESSHFSPAWAGSQWVNSQWMWSRWVATHWDGAESG